MSIDNGRTFMERCRMRVLGTRSWWLAEDVSQSLHAVLFIRDALSLAVEPGRGIPPPLAGPVPDRSSVLGSAARGRAAESWPGWWRAVLTLESERNLEQRVGDVQQKVRLMAERGRTVVDPPDWASLAGMPALQTAARALFVEGCHWADAVRPPFGLMPRSLSFDRRVIREVAKWVAKEAGVHTSAAHGCVQFINVNGAYWEIVSPGLALCSPEVMIDKSEARAVLGGVFRSAIKG